ncbi:MAG: hypothetical protein ABSB39_24505, partial [Candidatus Sulfotelmatobacter sp.]
RTASEFGSAERWVGEHAMSLPRTLSAGAPYAVLSSTPGNAKPIVRTLSKLIGPPLFLRGFDLLRRSYSRF